MSNLNKQALSLIFIILIAFAIRVYNLNYNSPFLDEAIYITLGKALFAGTFYTENPFSWVGGMPLLYPTVSALAYITGGIVGSRLVNVILGTLSVYLMYKLTKSLRFWKDEHLNKLTGIFSALFLAISEIPISLSRIATYDMLSFTFFLGGLVFLLDSLFKKNQNSYLWAAFCLLLAFLTKYTALMFFPFILLLAFFYTKAYNNKQISEVLFFIFMIVLGLGIYIGKFSIELSQFITIQVVNRSNLGSIGIIIQFLQFTYLPYLLGTLGLLALIYFRQSYTPILIFLLSFIPIIIHTITYNSDTLEQSTIFSLLFIFPFAAYLCTFITQKYKAASILVVIVIALLFMEYINTALRKEGLEHRWPNSTEAMKYLQKQVSGKDRILAESSSVTTLALDGKVPNQNINGPYYFLYGNKEGTQAYKKAIIDGYFNIVELNGLTSLTPTIKNIIDKKYRIIYDKDTFTIYKKINNE